MTMVLFMTRACLRAVGLVSTAAWCFECGDPYPLTAKREK
jgi:hypothetical protein